MYVQFLSISTLFNQLTVLGDLHIMTKCHKETTAAKASYLVAQYLNTHTHTRMHTHSVLTCIFPSEPGLAGCPLNNYLIINY